MNNSSSKAVKERRHKRRLDIQNLLAEFGSNHKEPSVRINLIAAHAELLRDIGVEEPSIEEQADSRVSCDHLIDAATCETDDRVRAFAVSQIAGIKNTNTLRSVVSVIADRAQSEGNWMALDALERINVQDANVHVQPRLSRATFYNAWRLGREGIYTSSFRIVATIVAPAVVSIIWILIFLNGFELKDSSKPNLWYAASFGVGIGWITALFGIARRDKPSRSISDLVDLLLIVALALVFILLAFVYFSLAVLGNDAQDLLALFVGSLLTALAMRSISLQISRWRSEYRTLDTVSTGILSALIFTIVLAVIGTFTLNTDTINVMWFIFLPSIVAYSCVQFEIEMKRTLDHFYAIETAKPPAGIATLLTVWTAVPLMPVILIAALLQNYGRGFGEAVSNLEPARNGNGRVERASYDLPLGLPVTFETPGDLGGAEIRHVFALNDGQLSLDIYDQAGNPVDVQNITTGSENGYYLADLSPGLNYQALVKSPFKDATGRTSNVYQRTIGASLESDGLVFLFSKEAFDILNDDLDIEHLAIRAPGGSIAVNERLTFEVDRETDIRISIDFEDERPALSDPRGVGVIFKSDNGDVERIDAFGTSDGFSGTLAVGRYDLILTDYSKYENEGLFNVVGSGGNTLSDRCYPSSECVNIRLVAEFGTSIIERKFVPIDVLSEYSIISLPVVGGTTPTVEANANFDVVIRGFSASGELISTGDDPDKIDVTPRTAFIAVSRYRQLPNFEELRNLSNESIECEQLSSECAELIIRGTRVTGEQDPAQAVRALSGAASDYFVSVSALDLPLTFTIPDGKKMQRPDLEGPVVWQSGSNEHEQIYCARIVRLEQNTADNQPVSGGKSRCGIAAEMLVPGDYSLNFVERTLKCAPERDGFWGRCAPAEAVDRLASTTEGRAFISMRADFSGDPGSNIPVGAIPLSAIEKEGAADRRLIKVPVGTPIVLTDRPAGNEIVLLANPESDKDNEERLELFDLNANYITRDSQQANTRAAILPRKVDHVRLVIMEESDTDISFLQAQEISVSEILSKVILEGGDALFDLFRSRRLYGTEASTTIVNIPEVLLDR